MQNLCVHVAHFYDYDHYNMIFAVYYLANYLAYRLIKDNLTEKKPGVKYETFFQKHKSYRTNF